MPVLRRRKGACASRQNPPAMSEQCDGIGDLAHEVVASSDGMYKTTQQESNNNQRSRRLSRSFKAFKCLSPLAALKEVRQTWNDETDYSRIGAYDSLRESDRNELRKDMIAAHRQSEQSNDMPNEPESLRVVEEQETEWEDEAEDMKSISPMDESDSNTPPQSPTIAISELRSLESTPRRPEPVVVIPDQDLLVVEETVKGTNSTTRIGIRPVTLQRPPDLHLSFETPSAAAQGVSLEEEGEEEADSLHNPVADDSLALIIDMSTSSSSVDSSEASPTLNLARRQLRPQSSKPDIGPTKLTESLVKKHKGSDLFETLSSVSGCSSDFLARSRYRQSKRAEASQARSLVSFSPKASSPFPGRNVSHNITTQKHESQQSSPVSTPLRRKDDPRMQDLIGKFESLSHSKAAIEQHSCLSRIGDSAEKRLAPMQKSPTSAMADINALQAKSPAPSNNIGNDHGFFWRSNPTAQYTNGTAC
mmetsp:Transcript_10258/g.28270  ORF Transcript_10258/g.28270 Transcript_10258/m.28270 type:complete len:476 (+) Transcript_10258:115-1542(+)